jgi:integrase
MSNKNSHPSESLLRQVPNSYEINNPAQVYLSRLLPGSSRRTGYYSLRTLAAILTGDPLSWPHLNWAALRYQHTQAIRSHLAATVSPGLANCRLSALKGVLRESRRLDQMSADDCARACDVPTVRGHRVPRGRALTQRELARLFDVCDSWLPRGARDAALLAVLYGGGLRRAEASALNLSDVALHDDGMRSLRVLGKGNKERNVYLTDEAGLAIEGWVAHRGDAQGPLFLQITKGGRRIVSRRLSEASVYMAILRLAARSGVAAFTPHDLRRTVIGDMLDAGADLASIQRQVGHAKIDTTARYDRRGDRAQKRAASLISMPFAPA